MLNSTNVQSDLKLQLTLMYAETNVSQNDNVNCKTNVYQMRSIANFVCNKNH